MLRFRQVEKREEEKAANFFGVLVCREICVSVNAKGNTRIV